jgi:hypothetical protein
VLLLLLLLLLLQLLLLRLLPPLHLLGWLGTIRLEGQTCLHLLLPLLGPRLIRL